MPLNRGTLEAILDKDENILIEKEKAYGDSWHKRGGTGAFMVLARKWDRIETQCERVGYNIFTGLEKYEGRDGLLDDIQDLRRYLALVEEYWITTYKGGPDIRKSINDTDADATRDYVDQDPRDICE